MGKDQRQTDYEKTPSGTRTGYFNNFILQKTPRWHGTNAEAVTEVNGCFQVQHRDRGASLASGAGGKGLTHCAAFTVITGLDSANGPTDEKRSPNRATDAATFYMTQKGQISNDFGLAKGATLGSNKIYRSGAALKSDRSAIIGREEVKIITGKMRTDSGQERLAQGGSYTGPGTIQLIAGNFTGTTKQSSIANLGVIAATGQTKYLQSVPKGDNLQDLLTKIMDKLNNLNGQILDNRRSIIEIGCAFNSHMHIGLSALGPVVSGPSPMIGPTIGTVATQFTKIFDNVAFSVNQGVDKVNYLDSNFPNYINSKNVSTT